MDEIYNISNNHLERTHLLTKKNLYNIEASYNLNNEKLRLVYYKSQGQIDTNCIELKEDDFLLLIMNDFKKSMLNKFKNYVMCIDDTHGMNLYHLI